MSYSERMKRLARRRRELAYAELERPEKQFAIGPVLVVLVVGALLLAVSLGLLNPAPLLEIAATAWSWFSIKY